MNEEIVKIKYCFQIYKYLKEVCSGLLKIYAPEFKKMENGKWKFQLTAHLLFLKYVKNIKENLII